MHFNHLTFLSITINYLPPSKDFQHLKSPQLISLLSPWCDTTILLERDRISLALTLHCYSSSIRTYNQGKLKAFQVHDPIVDSLILDGKGFMYVRDKWFAFSSLIHPVPSPNTELSPTNDEAAYIHISTIIHVTTGFAVK